MRRERAVSDVISLDDARRAARPDYVNRGQIESLLDGLEVEVGDIARGSVNQFGAIDPLAGEINAHVTAIRRALAVMDAPDTVDDK